MTDDERAAVHATLREVVESCNKRLDALVNRCDDMECSACAVIMCPFGDAFHFHHDGCPSCVYPAYKILSEREWRTIHNALAIHQCGFRQQEDRQRVQVLMDTVRDRFIAPYVKEAIDNKIVEVEAEIKRREEQKPQMD